MCEIKVKFPHYWIEIPSATPVSELAKILAKTKLKIRWNQKCHFGKRGFIEVYPTPHLTMRNQLAIID